MELGKGMGSQAVTNANKQQYVRLRAMQFFFGHELEFYRRLRQGLYDTIDLSDLQLFTAAELQRVIRGEQRIDLQSLKKMVLYSRGAAATHGVIQRFWDVVESFDDVHCQKLLMFWSGSPYPPLFGFESKYRSLNSVRAATTMRTMATGLIRC